MFVVRNYWNINSIYICCNARVYMHMTVYICIVCVCVCEQALHGGRREQRYSVCTFAGAFGSCRLRGKKCLLAFCRRRGKGQSDKVWTDSSPAFPSSGLILLFPRAWSAVSIFAASPAFSSRCYRFLHFNSYPLSLPLTTWSVSVDSFPLISMNLVPLQSIHNLPFFFFFFIFCVLCKSLSTLMWICVFFLCFWVKAALKMMVCPPNRTEGTEVCQNYMHNHIFSIYNIYFSQSKTGRKRFGKDGMPKVWRVL